MAVIILLLLFAGYVFWQTWNNFRAQNQVSWEVQSVLDGDTVLLKSLSSRAAELTVRLACIDAPEKAQFRIGGYAKAMLEREIAKGRNRIRLKNGGMDIYGRTLGLLFLENETISLNEKMIQKGGAHAHYLFGPLCQKQKERLLSYAFIATTKRLGIHKICSEFKMDCEKPWLWRKKNKLKHGAKTDLAAVEVAPKGFLPLHENF